MKLNSSILVCILTGFSLLGCQHTEKKPWSKRMAPVTKELGNEDELLRVTDDELKDSAANWCNTDNRWKEFGDIERCVSQKLSKYRQRMELTGYGAAPKEGGTDEDRPVIQNNLLRKRQRRSRERAEREKAILKEYGNQN